MNTNSSITGAAGSVDRVASVNKSTDNLRNEVHQSTESSSGITNMEQLKTAELRGDNITVSEEQVVKAIDRAMKAMQGKSTNLEFTVHETTKLIAVKVVDKHTGEVLREIPPEKSLDFVAKLWEMAGILIDEKI